MNAHAEYVCVEHMKGFVRIFLGLNSGPKGKGFSKKTWNL
jgi:hypothetical protein